jgi:hypothetical protein
MIGIETAAFEVLQRYGLGRGVLRQVMASRTPGGDDGLAPGDRELLIGDGGDDRVIETTVAPLELEQVTGDVDRVLTVHGDLGHAAVGTHLERVEEESP